MFLKLSSLIPFTLSHLLCTSWSTLVSGPVCQHLFVAGRQDQGQGASGSPNSISMPLTLPPQQHRPVCVKGKWGQSDCRPHRSLQPAGSHQRTFVPQYCFLLLSLGWAQHRRQRQIFGLRPKHLRSHLASTAGAELGSPPLMLRVQSPHLLTEQMPAARKINLSHLHDNTYPRVRALHQFCKPSGVTGSSSAWRRQEGGVASFSMDDVYLTHNWLELFFVCV